MGHHEEEQRLALRVEVLAVDADREIVDLLPAEHALYRTLKEHVLGPVVRLEQERIEWDFAWPILVDQCAAPQEFLRSN